MSSFHHGTGWKLFVILILGIALSQASRMAEVKTEFKLFMSVTLFSMEISISGKSSLSLNLVQSAFLKFHFVQTSLLSKIVLPRLIRIGKWSDEHKSSCTFH
uniref:Uncharacterized protein n=1 Tax=Cacopsylla melanoneura TaxID=428564 RepID=A0A8D8X505_9HEMI